MTTPFLEWTEHASAAVSAVHALLALAGSVRRSPAAKTDSPHTAGKVEEEGCSCSARALTVRVEVACAAEAIVVIRLDALTLAPASADAGAVPDAPSGGERGPW